MPERQRSDPQIVVGMIWECGPRGPDQQVCEHIVQSLAPRVRISPATLDNKPNLIADCGRVAKALLDDGCRKVVIVWDLISWKVPGRPICLGRDRDEIFRSLRDADVPLNAVHLVCIIRELEAWLLADGRALSSVLSTLAHRTQIADVRRPWREPNPKKRLNRIFQQHSGCSYVDRIHALAIFQAMPDFQKVRRCDTFRRFVEKATGTTV